MTVEDMVKLTLGKGEDFGIEGYNIPKFGFLSQGITWKMTKEKGKSFADTAAYLVRAVPGPGMYPI